jgi:hypothetical protein
MNQEIQKWIDKGFKYAFTYNGKGLDHALKHKFVTTNEPYAIKQAKNILAKEKNVRIFDLNEQLTAFRNERT